MGVDELWAAAERQHGMVLRRELGGLGVSRGRARRLVADGWLRQVLPGVLSFGGATPTEWQKAVAATLLAGSGSAMSHSSAARVHRLAVPSGPSSDPSSPRLVDGRVADGRVVDGRVVDGRVADGRVADVAVEISIAPGSHRRIRGAVVHRERALRDDEVELHRGVRVTVPSRTLVDLLPRLTPSALEKLVDEGSIRGIWDYNGLAVAADRAKGPQGR
jgi:hypothetical protein